MKKPWLRWTALTFALGLSGFVACSNSGGMAGSSGGMPGCGGTDEATKCNQAKSGNKWDGTQCLDSSGKPTTY